MSKQTSIKALQNAVPPARSEEEQIARCGSYAYTLAEESLRAGTASPAIISHFLKLNSPEARLTRKKLEKEIELLEAKTQAIQNGQSLEESFEKAISALQKYGGNYNSNEPTDLR